jgi:hypothetical protein
VAIHANMSLDPSADEPSTSAAAMPHEKRSIMLRKEYMFHLEDKSKSKDLPHHKRTRLDKQVLRKTVCARSLFEAAKACVGARSDRSFF